MLTQRKRTVAGSRRNNSSGRSVTSESPASAAPGPQPRTKLYSVAGLMNERTFTGNFNARGTTYNFSFAPTSATLNDKRQLELTGRFIVSARRGASRAVPDARATLIATQGGIGSSPTRRQALVAATTTSGNIATPQQKQEEAKAPETKQEPAAPAAPAPSPSALPITEATDDLAFAAAMYFQLSPLDARALGLPVDMSRVQLNARLAPTSDFERDLHLLYSDVVAATGGEKINESDARRYVEELDRVLRGARAASHRSPHNETRESPASAPGDVHIHFQLLEAAE
ncbi:MAG TPA: hypothetical protein VM866_03540 [Pyrinomonadaceae bacterium]|nr:hypothetical protein [Pyrinomonadaceae bacterium]